MTSAVSASAPSNKNGTSAPAMPVSSSAIATPSDTAPLTYNSR
jgi:hypothetical protein